jgi:hypothetical protein
MGGIVEQDWGEEIQMFERTNLANLPLVLHFRPQKIVRVKKAKLQEFETVVRENLGIVFADGPQPTISGSGDGWDDCD